MFINIVTFQISKSVKRMGKAYLETVYTVDTYFGQCGCLWLGIPILPADMSFVDIWKLPDDIN